MSCCEKPNCEVGYDTDCTDLCFACTICCPLTTLLSCFNCCRVLFLGDVTFNEPYDEALPHELAAEEVSRVCSVCCCYPCHFIFCCWTCRMFC